MKKEVTYDSMPNAVAELSEKLDLLFEIISTKIEKKEEIPKFLDEKRALQYMTNMGFKMSESKLYKMTSKNSIPCHRSGRILYFIPAELDVWLNEQIARKSETSDLLSVQTMIKKAQRKNK